MANNFEIIFNMDASSVLADGTKKRWTIDECIDIANRHNCKWITAPHVPDEKSSFNHWHFGIHTDSNNSYETIAKWFNIPVNAVQGIKKKFDSTYALYIIHYNQEGKTPVPVDLVRSSFSIDYDKLVKNVSNAHRLDEILTLIDNGTIRQYNYTQYITNIDYVKYQRQIDNAFKYRIDKMRGIERNMECVFITGDSGVGKTSYAKKVAFDRNYSVYVSSGSNDVLDDYKGEECIILDDLRPSCLSLSDLLKMLDNNTASSVKSRFKNKVLECKLIIITSTLPLEDFFSQVFENENETKVQLLRRCGLYLVMTEDEITFKMYNPVSRCHEYVSSLPNVILEQFNYKELSEEERMKKVCAILGGSADMFNAMKKGIEDHYFKPADDVIF